MCVESRRVAAQSRHDFVIPVAVKVGAGQSVAISKALVDNIPLPKLAAPLLEVNDHLLSMPGLERGEEPAPGDFTHADLARTLARRGARGNPRLRTLVSRGETSRSE